jgi:uncharacterized protein with HEPN domain
MTKDPTYRIRHVLEEIAILQSVVADSDRQSFAEDQVKLRAAAYSLQNISEAVRNIPDEILTSHKGIEWAKIRGLGNFTRHEYFRVDPNVLWETMTTDLNDLTAVMQTLLKSLGSNV